MGKGKRNSVVVISSSDDDENDHFVLKSNVRISTSAPTRKNSKRVKRSSLPNSCSQPFIQCSDSNDFDEVKRFCEEFDQGFTQFKVSSDSGRNQDMWVDKYKPMALEELAVHKKKVEEVKIWFEERLKYSMVGMPKCDNDIDLTRFFYVGTWNLGSAYNNVLLVCGPSGVGKSATVNAIASHLGADVCEWNTPTPTIWQEHLYTSNSGIRYMSKLEEFESFVERIRKYGLVSSPLTTESGRPVILLIDDLPAVNGKVYYGRLQRCLHNLLQSVCLPTVIFITDYGISDPSEHRIQKGEELQLSLQNAGAAKVTFNPITVNSIKKTLRKICKAEQFEASDEQINLIAKASGGDVRHAITTLQYFSLKHPAHSSCSMEWLSTPTEDKQNVTTHTDSYISFSFGKDANVSLFHALGKFLHNKRDTRITASEGDELLLKDKLVRFPLKMDSPELVLNQAHGQARIVADFLQENVLDFMSDEAIEDAWVVSAYLSDADLLLSPLSGTSSRNFETENVMQSTAASIAVRGVLFGNACPLSSRWHAIRRSQIWQAERLLWQNKSRMMGHDYVLTSMSLNNGCLSVFATEVKPLFNWLENRAHEDTECCVSSNEVDRGVGECSDVHTWHNKNGGGSMDEDEIEDW